MPAVESEVGCSATLLKFSRRPTTGGRATSPDALFSGVSHVPPAIDELSVFAASIIGEWRACGNHARHGDSRWIPRIPMTCMVRRQNRSSQQGGSVHTSAMTKKQRNRTSRY